MKKVTYLLIAIAIFASSCMGGAKNKEKETERIAKEESNRMMDSTAAPSSGSNVEKSKAANDQADPNVVSSTAAVQSKTDTARKFVRTADLKFKVKNVYQSTIEIENVTAKYNGFVTYTNLYSTIDDQTKNSVSADSTLETIYYTVVNNITIRVPNYNLDSTIRGIAHLITYLDYRTIKANDVSLTLAANNMAQQRINKSSQKLSYIAGKKNIQTGEATNIEQNLENNQAQLDQVKYDKMKLMDEVSYSTLNIYIYQHQSIKHEVVENEKSIKDYEPGFLTKLKEALVFSWDICIAVFLFIVRIWFIILIIVVGVIILKKFVMNKPKA